MRMGITLLVILALLPPLALQTQTGFTDIVKQNRTNPEIALGFPTKVTNGFQLMPSVPIFRYLSRVQNVTISSWPMALSPPFQIIFTGPIKVNI